ncbi:MAG TPA: D-alanyl-D-alanine carboxypeptidase/D-alanyl-D-alanine-endopeptidase [Burkholderiaceae bacterium]
MQKFSRFVHCVFIGFSLVSVACQAAELPGSLRNALKHAGIPLSAVGIEVQQVGNPKPLLAMNGDEAFSPASTMKLLTTQAALELLGPTFTWKTQAYVSGNVSGDQLQGDLIFKGSGDPKLVTENFWLFLRQIRDAGLREIRGNVVLDRSAFERVQIDPAKFDGDPSKPYNVAPDAMLLNYQSLRFQFNPTALGGAPQITIDPPLADYDVVTPHWAAGDCGDWQGRLGANIGESGARFTGSYANACGIKTWYVVPYQMAPNQYFSAVFRKMWHDLGGRFTGKVVDGTTPADARLISVWESPTLADTVRDMNKFSNNLMARHLLLTLAATDGDPGAPQSASHGALVLANWLAGKGIAAPELVVENGSGLSRAERIAPANMAKLLQVAYRSPLMPEFISSLPLVGYDGTMRHRLNDKDVAGNAHIKTGTLNEVKAIAGYVVAASGKTYAVVFFINHANAAGGGAAQDALLQWVYAEG